MARRMSTGSAALSKLTLNPPKFLKLTMPVPKRSRQEEVVAVLNNIEAKINQIQLTRSVSGEDLDALLPSFIEQAFKGDVEFGKLGQVLRGKPRNGWSARCDNSDSGTPVLSLGAVTGFDFHAASFKRTSLPTNAEAHYWLKKGDLLMTRSNTPELVGHAAIYDGQPLPCIYPDLMMRLDVNQELADTKFVWWWLRSRRIRQIIREKAKGTSPTMKKIGQGVVMDLPFPLLLPEQQKELVCRLDNISATARELKQQTKESLLDINKVVPRAIDRIFRNLIENKGEKIEMTAEVAAYA